MKKIITTDRLILRELVASDQDQLAAILCSKVEMRYYPRPFSALEVDSLIQRCIDGYTKYGHGLWAVLLKPDNIFIGDCGITMQDMDGETLPEIGYHIKKEFCNNGYATEAALACKEYAFDRIGYDAIYIHTSIHNLPSIRVAQKIGLQKIKQFTKKAFDAEVEAVLYGESRIAS